MSLPFRVVDFTRVLAGPWATQTLGDQGFDVIKIESPEGDETRRFAPMRGGESVYFACCNRNKRSVVLDLKHPDDLALAKQLIAQSDVVVENFRAGVMERLGLGDAVLRAAHPGLVSVSIHAFGEHDPRAGYDLVLQAVGGIAALTADPPQKAGPSIADLASAQIAVQAVLFGLLERARTGLGTRRVISMLDVQHALLAYYASAWLNAGVAPPPPSNAHPSIAPYNLYRCDDGYLAICCANEGLWQRLCAAIALPQRTLWASMPGRVADRAALDAAIEHHLRGVRVAVWECQLSAVGVPCGAALTVPQTLAHPLARTTTLGDWRFPEPPLGLLAHRPPPRLGEHTDEILGPLRAAREKR